MFIIIRILGMIGLALGLLAFLFRHHKQIVMCKMFSVLSFSLQYFLIGPSAYTAALLDLFSAIRNFFFYRLVEKGKSTTPIMIISAAVMATLGIVSWAGPITLLATIPKIMTSVSYGLKNERLLRLITLPSCLAWIAYNLIVKNYEAAIGDFINFSTIIYAIIKYDIIEKREKA